jgi:alkaline phosphatase
LVKKYIDENPDTIMVSTSDHETGGLSIAKQLGKEYPTNYLWYISCSEVRHGTHHHFILGILML